MSNSTQDPATQPWHLSSTTTEPSDEQHRCGNCGGRLRTVALVCTKRDCGDMILDDTTASEADLRRGAARKHACPHCGTFGDPAEMLECSGCPNPVRMDNEAEASEIASGPAVGAIVAGNGERQDISAAVDEPVTAREQVTAASDQSNIVLKLAPEYFKLAVTASGVSAVLAGRIEHGELYRAEGFSSFREYAEKKLGISSNSAFKKLRQAARAVWEFYPDLAAAVLSALGVDGHARVHDLPHVPDETKLYLLKRAYENTSEDERPHLLKKALNEDCSTRQLEEMARRGRKAKPPQDTAHRGERRGAGAPTAEQAQHAPVALTPPTQAAKPTPRSGAPLGPTTPTDSGSAADTPHPRAEARPDADGTSVNGQDLLSHAFWGLDAAFDALSRLPPGEIAADRLSSLRALFVKVQRALADHEEVVHG